MREEKATENLFSYGTLQREGVQLGTFGRVLEGKPDALAGYISTTIPIHDQGVVEALGRTHYPNIRFTGVASDLVEGTVFVLTGSELEQADEYEVDADYERVRVQLNSGTNAWVYLVRQQ